MGVVAFTMFGVTSSPTCARQRHVEPQDVDTGEVLAILVPVGLLHMRTGPQAQ